MHRNKILIISRLIFPAQNPRSHRATELAKELARQGHEVVLYGVLGKYDYSAFESEYHLKVRNLGRMIFATYNSDEKIRNNIIDKVLNKLLRRILEYPDLELMFRIPRIIRSEKNVDLLVSVAAPYPLHWGCALSKQLYKKSFPSIWAADCGDPYMGNIIKGEKGKYFYFKYPEKWFCNLADHIILPFEGAKEGYYAEFRKKIKVIPQGFRFDDTRLCEPKPTYAVPTFAYAGVFYSGIRNPSSFLSYLTTLNEGFKFIVYTKNVQFILPFQEHLGEKIEIRGYVPREELLYELSKMDFLVNFENNTNIHLPSKLIDYAMVKRPILSIPSNALPVATINEFLDGDYHNQFIVHDVEKYNITRVAGQFYSLSRE